MLKYKIEKNTVLQANIYKSLNFIETANIAVVIIIMELAKV